MKQIALLAFSLALLGSAGCTSADRSPDQLRKETAKATETVARDAKAVEQGVVDGLKKKGSVNINDASEQQLEALPGMDSIHARRIIASRPYASPDDLVKRRVVARAEYDRIAGQLVTE